MRAACADSLHVLTNDGRVLHGAEAIVFMSRLSGLLPNTVAAVAGLGPVAWVLERAYDQMARNRSLVGRYVFRSDEGPFARPDVG